MVDVELLLSDNGGVRIYPTEWHNTIYFGYQKNANIYRLHIVRSKVWNNLTVRAFFHTADKQDPPAQLFVNDYVNVPALITAKTVGGVITIEGTDGTHALTTADIPYVVSENSGVEDGSTPEPASPAWVQLVAEINAEAEAAKAAAKIANDSAIKAQSALNDLLQGIRDGDFIGLPGPEGPQGPQGVQGPVGPQGPQGEIGPVGPQGPRGTQGVNGPQGIQGPKGDPGPQGPQGDVGPQGEVGPRGLQGETGPAGPQGIQGPIGPVGPVGPKGEQGPAGPEGPKGEQGNQGPKGETGNPFSAANSQATISIETSTLVSSKAWLNVDISTTSGIAIADTVEYNLTNSTPGGTDRRPTAIYVNATDKSTNCVVYGKIKLTNSRSGDFSNYYVKVGSTKYLIQASEDINFNYICTNINSVTVTTIIKE